MMKSEDKPVVKTEARPEVSIIVATYNAAATLGGCIDSLLAQTYPAVEILIVDDGSTDATPEILAEHPERHRFVTIRLTNGGPSRARNVGVARARGELVAFFDSDIRAEPRCLEELVAALGDDRVVAVGGAQRAAAADSPFGRAVQRYFESIGFVTDYMQRGGREDVVETSHNPSCNVVYRCRAVVAAGGFDELLWPGEDVDLDRRLSLAGYRHLFNRRAVVAHFRPASPPAFRRMMFRYGRSQMLLLRRYGLFRKIQGVGVLGLLAPVVAGLCLWLAPRLAASALLAGIASALLGLEIYRRATRQGLRFYDLFFSNIVFWFAGFARELVSPQFARRPRLARSEP